MSSQRFNSPKQNGGNKKNKVDAFPYYAGFSEAFAEDAIKSLTINDDIVLDPWNGAGTTTSLSCRLKRRAFGIDLNPVMVHVAKARSCSLRSRRYAITYLHKTIKTLTSKNSDLDQYSVDSLTPIVGRKAALFLRNLVSSILKDDAIKSENNVDAIQKISTSCAAWQSFLILAIIRAIKNNSKIEKSSNPTWTKNPTASLTPHEISIDEWCSHINKEAEHLLNIGVTPENSIASQRVKIICASSTRIPIKANSVDFVLGSPPYCTRIDYAKLTLTELAVLGLNSETVDRELRRKLIGTTAIKRDAAVELQQWGKTCTSTLKKILEHPSTGSKSYYYKNFSQYFEEIYKSLTEVMRVLKPSGSACIVVQGSHYKEIQIDLPTIIIEMASSVGLELIEIHSYKVSQNFIHINKASTKYRKEQSVKEKVILLRPAIKSKTQTAAET